MTAPLRVEIVVLAPTVFHHCRHCEVVWNEAGLGRRLRADQLRRALPDDLEREHEAVSAWVHRLLETYGERVEVKVTDATSLRGFWKSLRHGLRRYPAIVVDGRARWVGTDLGAADALVARRLGAGAPG